MNNNIIIIILNYSIMIIIGSCHKVNYQSTDSIWHYILSIVIEIQYYNVIHAVCNVMSYNYNIIIFRLAGQPLLTQKARKGLVNEGTFICPQVEHTTYIPMKF